MHDYLRLGASLYVPATRGDLAEIAAGTRLASLRSVIFCTEDAIAAADVDQAVENVGAALAVAEPSPLLRFVRVRNPAVMGRVLALAGVERLDGFVLPKTTRRNFAAYAELLTRRDRCWLLPTLETAEAFDADEMRRFRRELADGPHHERILALRIGGNDLLNLLALRRAHGETIYDTALGSVISSLVTIFRPAGFQLTAPVFDRLDAPSTLAREVRQDIAHGLSSKSAVHPLQVATIECEYAVTPEDLAMARSILDPASPPVYQLHGCLCEPATHMRWAQSIVERRRLYGIRTAGEETPRVALALSE